MTTINVLLQGGLADGHLTTIHKETAPVELRVVSKVAEKGTDTVEASVYRVMRVDPMPVKSLGLSAVYFFQGTRPSAWSLIDFTV